MMFDSVKKCVGIFVMGALLPITVAHAQPYQTYVIHTHGNPALVQIVQNELSPTYGGHGGTATLYQDRLIIRATPADYARILPLIQQIDTAPTALTLSVSTSNHLTNSSSGGYINGGIVRQGVWINGEYQSTASQSTTNTHYSVRTLSDSPATISTNTLIGLTSHQIRQNRHRLWVNFGTSWITLTDGFSATPRLLPNGQISLSINASSASTHTLTNSGTTTTVTLSRGQWTKIGEIRSNNQYADNYGQNSYSQTMPIWVKVD